MRSLLGESDEETSAEEIAWAFRKLLEEQAPLVCVFEDIQWGEETFLELLEGAALLARAPILILCLARPELVERRPEWPVSLRLDPLSSDDVNALLEDVPNDLHERIARAGGGNPLFVIEMAAMAREAKGEVVVPPTLKALLVARLDQLDADERSALERGAIEGEVFHRGAVQALAAGGRVTPPLAALVRKGLIRPHKALLPGDDAFRFRHLLIRDAAYEALPKATRAALHMCFADWLEERGQDVVELDEILGYHLEQASRWKEDLGQPHRDLAERAAGYFAAAGRRALWRLDTGAAAALLERALTLTRPIRLDVHLELDLARAHGATPREAAGIAEAAAERARSAGDLVGEATARILAGNYRMSFDANAEELETLIAASMPLLQQSEDDAALVVVWSALGGIANLRGQFEEWALAAERAIGHARLAGQSPTRLWAIAVALDRGPRPADEALATLDAVLPEIRSPDALLWRSSLLAMLGRFDEAWSVAHDASERLRELTGSGSERLLAEVATLAGDQESAIRYLRRDCDDLKDRGNLSILSTYAPRLGHSLCALGRFDEAEEWMQLGRALGGEEDVATQALWRQVQALIHAHRGEHAPAERLAREALAITERADSLTWQGDALRDLATVLAAAGRTDEAAAALEQALDRYERKKNLAMVAQVTPKLEELRGKLAT